jgi:hypothetical protein
VPFNVKTMLIFQHEQGYGWTETHYNLYPGSQPPNLNNYVGTAQNTLCPLRAQMLGASSTIVGIRCSYPVTKGQASLPKTVSFPGYFAQAGASQNDSIALAMYDGTFSRKKLIHLRDPWNEVVQNANFDSGDSFGAWPTLVKNYTSALINNNYGWLGANSSTKIYGNMQLYTTLPSGQVQFTLQFFSSTTPVEGIQYNVRFSKINYSKSVLNRQILCYFTSPNLLTTVNPIAAGAQTSQGQFLINFNNFILYSNVGTMKIGERRMGKVLGRYPGRSRVHPRT